MPDNFEKIESGFFYHIYNHAIGHDNIFKEDENYLFFLRLLKKHLTPYSEIISYSLLPNHYHILLRFNETNLSNPSKSSKLSEGSIQLSKLFNSYAQAFNKKYKRRGSLFIHKFKRKKVTDEKFLKNLIIYINTNSVHHGFTEHPKDWKFSSYTAIISNKATLIKRDFVITLFDSIENFRYCSEKDIDLEKELTFE